jgi:hypothetical protein
MARREVAQDDGHHVIEHLDEWWRVAMPSAAEGAERLWLPHSLPNNIEQPDATSDRR